MPGFLSLAQQSQWVLDQLDRGNPANSIGAAQHIWDRLDLTLLKQSPSGTVQRHPILRSTFPSANRPADQNLSSNVRVALPIVDPRGPEQAEREVRRLAKTMMRCTNLSGRPSFRERIHRAQQVVSGVSAYQDLPLGASICRELGTRARVPAQMLRAQGLSREIRSRRSGGAARG